MEHSQNCRRGTASPARWASTKSGKSGLVAVFAVGNRSVGFTLIEMLIVIAIFSILASLLLPTIQKAAASGRAIRCTSNLRQVGIGFSGYANDNRNFFPTPTVRRYGYDNGFTWVYSEGETFATNPSWGPFPWYMTLITYGGYLAPMGKKWGVAHPAVCDEFVAQRGTDIYWDAASGSSAGWEIYKRGGTYCYNASLDRNLNILSGKPAIRRITTVRNPSERFVVGDGTAVHMVVSANLATFESTGTTATGLWFGHGERTQLVYIDGHAAAKIREEIPVCADFRYENNPGSGVGGETTLDSPW